MCVCVCVCVCVCAKISSLVTIVFENSLLPFLYSKASLEKSGVYICMDGWMDGLMNYYKYYYS